MKIDRVGFGATLNTGNYEKIELYLEAELEPWEDPLESIKALRRKIYEFQNDKQKSDELERKADLAETRLSNANHRLKTAKARWEELVKVRDQVLSILMAAGVSEEKLADLKSRFPNTPNFDSIASSDDTENSDDDTPW